MFDEEFPEGIAADAFDPSPAGDDWHETVRFWLTILFAVALVAAFYYGIPALYDLTIYHIIPWFNEASHVHVLMVQPWQ